MGGAPSPEWDAARVIAHLKTLGSEANRAGMARFGINTEAALGVPNAILRPLARALKRDHGRALDLWQSGIREARLLASFTADSTAMTPDDCRRWAAASDSWEIVDSNADLFAATPYWRELVDEFAADEREFVRRTGFSMLASAAVHRKEEPEATFIRFLGLIEAHATDGRNFVKKAVNWALRQIGKRSMALREPALGLAERLAVSPDRTARWIGNDAVKELTGEKTLAMMAKRAR